MNAILERLNSTGAWFVEFAVPMLVQSSVLILILLLVDLALRKRVRAVFRYWIWLLVLAKLVLPSSLSSPLSLGYFLGDELAEIKISEAGIQEEPFDWRMIRPAPPLKVPEEFDLGMGTAAGTEQQISPVESGVAEEFPKVGPESVTRVSVTWQGAVFLVWAVVVAMMGLLLLQRAMFVRGLVAQAKEPNRLMKETLEFCRGQMGLKGKVRLKVSTNAASPAVCGLFRPVILVPANLGRRLGSRDLRAVLLHELAHIKRGDLWLNLAQTVLQIVYFYNPLLWFANAMIRRVREQAVDEMVLVAMGDKAKSYPETLVNVAKLAFKQPMLSLRLIGVVESKNALAGRIKRILSRPLPKTAKLGVLGLIIVLAIGCGLLPMAKVEKADVQVEGENGESRKFGAVEFEGDKYNLMVRGGKGQVEALDPNAANLIRRYLRALEKSDWKTALSMCSISVMDKAQQYPTHESFFNTVVPVKEILNKLRDPCIGYGTRPPKYFAYIFDVIISKPDMPRDVSWQWKARKLEGRANWEIDFPAIPFETWLANEKQVIIRAVKEKEQLIKELAPRLKGVRTLLAAEREEFVVGEPIYFRLRIINQGDSILSYDCQQVAVDNSMTIEGPDGKEIKYTAEYFQTLGSPVLFKPGETKTLFDQFDITKQYDIRQPGQYRVQYNGKGLSFVLGKEDPPDLNDPRSWKYLPGILPSNVVIITIRSGIKQETLDVGKDGVEGEKAVSQTNTEDKPDVPVDVINGDALYQKQGSIRYALEFIGMPEELIDTAFVSKRGQLANPQQLEFANKLFSVRKSKDVDMFISLLSDGTKKQLNDDDNNKRMLHHHIKEVKDGTFLYGEYDFKFFVTFRKVTEKLSEMLKKHVSFAETPSHAIHYWHFHKPNYMLIGGSYYLIEDEGSYKLVTQTLLSEPVIPVKEEQPTDPKGYGIVSFKQNDNAYTQRSVWKYEWNIELDPNVSENNTFQLLKTTKVISGNADLHPEIAVQKIIDESVIEKYKYKGLKYTFRIGNTEPSFSTYNYGQKLTSWSCGFSIANMGQSKSIFFPGKDITNIKTNKQGNFIGSDLELLSFETSEGNVKYEHKVILRKSDSPEAKSAALLRLEQMTRRRISNKKLQYLNRILTTYANDHNSKYPDRLEQIKPYDTDEWLDWLLENIEYLGKGKTLTETSNTVLAYDKTLLGKAGRTNVLFNDGPVQYCNPDWLKKLGITGNQKSNAQVEYKFPSDWILMHEGFYSFGEGETYSKRLSQIFSKVQSYVEQISAGYGNKNWDDVSEGAIQVHDIFLGLKESVEVDEAGAWEAFAKAWEGEKIDVNEAKLIELARIKRTLQILTSFGGEYDEETYQNLCTYIVSIADVANEIHKTLRTKGPTMISPHIEKLQTDWSMLTEIDGNKELLRSVFQTKEKTDVEVGDEPAWGQAVDGLQLGLAFDEEKQTYAPGEEITLQIYARNNGDSEVPFSLLDLGLRQPSVVPSKKFNITKGSASPSGGGLYLIPNNTVLLQPGETAMLTKTKYRDMLDPGRYRISQSCECITEKLREGYPPYRSHLFTTGELEFVVAAGPDVPWGEVLNGLRLRIKADGS